MSGEGAKYTYFSQLKNIVLVADTDEEFEKENNKRKIELKMGWHEIGRVYWFLC